MYVGLLGLALTAYVYWLLERRHDRAIRTLEVRIERLEAQLATSAEAR